MSTQPQVSRRGLLALATVAGVSACARHASATTPTREVGHFTSPTTPTRGLEGRDAVVALCRQMTSGLVHRDKALFLGAIAPTATAGRAAASQWFDAIQAVPMRQRGFLPVSGFDGWLEPGAKDPWTIAFVHQVEGVDRYPVEEWYGAPLVRSGSGTLFAGWGGVKDVDPTGDSTYVGYYKQLWDDGPVRFTRGQKAALLSSTRHSADQHRSLLATIDPAVTRAATLLSGGGVDLADHGALLITLLDAEGKGLLDYMGGARTPPQAQYAGFACGLPRLDGQHQPRDDAPMASARIIMGPDSIDSDDDLGVMIRHESTHAQLMMAWGNQDERLPWTSEGVAQWMEVDGDHEGRAFLLRRAHEAFPKRVASADDVDYWKGDDDAVEDSYAVAYAAFTFVVETKSLRTALAMMRTTFPGGSDDGWAAGGYQGVEDFDRQLGAWLPKQV